jgi:integrase
VRTTQKGPLADSIELYLAHKRSLGKQLIKVGAMLHLMDRYLLALGVSKLGLITSAHLEEFVASRQRSPRSYNSLIGSLRGLFDWLVVHDVLSASPLRCEPRRVKPGRRPFLFSAEQVQVLLDAAARLPDNPRAQARGEIYRMIFALLYGLGLRVGEVSRLCRKDIDLETQVLFIRQTKFGKDRLVPFGPRMAAAITAFLEREETRCGPILPDAPVFSFGKQKRTPVGTNAISWTFHKLVAGGNFVVPTGVAPPHLHCLRHSFAVSTLLRWYRSGIDPMSRLFDLSTFLGHVSPSSTAIYLTITTELLQCANERFARFAANSRKECVR